MKPRHENRARAISRRENIPRPGREHSGRDDKGAKTIITMTINRPAEELFGFWRNFENLPRVMEHVESVRCLNEQRSEWRVWRSKDKQVNGKRK